MSKPVIKVNGNKAGISLLTRLSKKPVKNCLKSSVFLAAKDDVIT